MRCNTVIEGSITICDYRCHVGLLDKDDKTAEQWSWYHCVVFEMIIHGNPPQLFQRIYGTIIQVTLVEDLSAVAYGDIEPKFFTQ